MRPTDFDPLVVDAVDRASRALDVDHLPIHSGAFHDALRLNTHCPTGMVFVPSVGRVSHSAEERTELRDLALGARTLAEVVVDLADG
jgi:N-carbamoyl-L-amino-acid hydrolase